jgi:phosphonate transport system substrate-binding protein
MVNRRSLLQGSIALGVSSNLQKVLAAAKQLHVGVMPTLSARIIASQYAPMRAYLNTTLETEVILSTATDVSSFYRNIRSDSYEVVISAAHVARLIQLQHGFVPIANFQPKVKCVLVTLKSSTSYLKTLAAKPQISYSEPISLITFEGEKWLAKQGLKADIDYQLARVKSAENIGMSIVRGEAGAGIVSLNAFLSHPASIRDQLTVAHLIAEIPAYYIMASPRLTPSEMAKLTEVLNVFSAKSTEGKAFEEQTSFLVATRFNEKELANMDGFLDRTRKMLS